MISGAKSCAITGIIARRIPVRKRLPAPPNSAPNKSQYPRPGVCRAHTGMTVAGSVRIREAVVEMPLPYSYGNSPYHRPTISSTCAATSSDTSALNAATRWQIPRSVPSQSSE